jgi:hypothetical protein
MVHLQHCREPHLACPASALQPVFACSYLVRISGRMGSSSQRRCRTENTKLARSEEIEDRLDTTT